MKRNLLWGLLLLLCVNMQATSLKNTTYGDVVINEVTSVYDGDTFRANIESFHPVIGKRIGIRVSGVDTPEMKGKCKKEKKLARRAKQFTVSFLRNAKTIELKNIKRGKYFRIVADVYADGKNLSESLISNKLGVKYYGGKKSKNWCL